ncbi:MAG: hypothetical protein QHH02_00700 [Syntrophomonadaceae bacterium]|nr:hypothetical protein [Syntrophomonadaceae bacterium]
MTTAHGLLTPAQVCRMLRITPDQIGRLIAQGWLEVALVDHLRHGPMRLFESSRVQALIPQMPKIRRAWVTEDNQRLGGSTAARRREEGRQQAEELRKRKLKFLSSLQDLPQPYCRLLQVCFYLYHLNHYAKRGETYLYDLKEKVLKALVQRPDLTGPSLKVYFVPGSERVRLCERCRNRAARMNKTRPEYIRLYGGCSRCTRESDYYSLYELLITYDTYRFCFHVPFMVARKWFKGQLLPPKEGGAEREGFTVYGRPIFEAEARAVELIEVVDELETFLAEQRELLEEVREYQAPCQNPAAYSLLGT